MNSSNSRVLPEAMPLEHPVEVVEHLVDACTVLVGGVLERLLHAGEALVEHLPAEQVLDLLVVGARLRGRASRTTTARSPPQPCSAEGSRSASRRTGRRRRGPARAACAPRGRRGRAARGPAAWCRRAGAAAAARGACRPPGERARRDRAAPVRRAAAEVLPHRPLRRVAGHDVLADVVERLRKVDRRRQRVAARVAPVGAHPGFPRRCAEERSGGAERRGVWLIRRPSPGPRSPCRCAGPGRDPRGPARSRRRAARASRRHSRAAMSSYSSDSPRTGSPSRKSPAVTCSPVVTAAPSSRAATSSARSRPAEPGADGLGGGGAQQVLEDLELAALLAGLELDLAAEHLDGGLEVDDPRDRLRLALRGRAVQRGGGDRLRTGDGEARADAAALVDGVRLAQGPGEPGQDLDQVVGHLGDEVRLLPDHRDLVVERRAGSACGSRRRSGP